MKAYLYTEQPLTPKPLQVLKAAKEHARISQEIHFAELEDGQVPPTGFPVLALGKYNRRGQERVVQTYSVAQLMAKADSVTVLARALNNLVKAPDVLNMKYEVIRDKDRYFEVMDALDSEDYLVFDVETSGDLKTDYFNEVQLLCFSFCQAETPQYVVAEEIANDMDVLQRLVQFKLLGHNLSFDVKVINALLQGTACARIDYDTMLAHWIMFPSSDAGLKPLAKMYFGVEDWDDALKPYTKTKKYKEHTQLEDGAWADARSYSGGSGYERIPRTVLYRYNAVDTAVTRALAILCEEYLSESESKRKAFNTRIEAANMYMDFEVKGTRVDVDHLKALEAELEDERVRLLQELEDIAGQPINPNSPKQVKEWLTDEGANVESTSETVLELALRNKELSERAESFVRKLLECRGNTKALGTYVKATLDRSRDGVIHPSFKLHGVATGRLSTPGSGVGLMTIPRDKKYRKMVIPYQEGHVLVKPDYGQLEARVTAVLSGDERYIGAFQPGSPDFFIALLPSVFPDLDFDTMPKEEMLEYRTLIKPFSHGAHYGRGASAIAEALDMPVAKAEEILENYLGDHDKGLRKWQGEIRRKAVSGETIETPFGLHLQSEIVTSRNRHNVENTALSFLPQSIGNSICLQACLRIHKWIHEYGGHIFLTVHDQILASVPIENAKEVGERMEQEMVQSGKDTFGDVVIFEAAPEYGFNWAEKMDPDEWEEYLSKREA